MKEFISTMEAAKLLGISRVAVFNKIQSGEIKAVKAGRNYIIPSAAIMDLAQKNVLSAAGKTAIDRGVDRVISQYGETLRLLKDH